ncbi:hypothetical protein [Dyella sp. M7H15-1]|uniref:hypothetical protein n=1 Tax=Dyella sp. M7H15-1 TaxID=2501295 RepID=UPI001F0BB444|nr:hypothetical protein [Dyella sp. M7H15-1]
MPLALTLMLDAYAAPDWLAQWVLRGPQAIDIDAAPDGRAHVFRASADETAPWRSGRYWYRLRMRRGEELREVERGDIDIEPDFAQLPEGYDGRSPFELALAAIDAVLAKRATQDQLRYRINNRELWRTPIPDLIALRTYYAARVRHECAKRKGQSRFGRNIVVRFSS